LGHQSEIEVARKFASEVDAERGVTRPDRTLLAEQRDQGFIDLRPGAGSSYLVQGDRYLLFDRAKRLGRYGLAIEAQATLKEVGQRRDIIDGMHANPTSTPLLWS
jgi:hypothetical protein